jgi:hypothetical protein
MRARIAVPVALSAVVRESVWGKARGVNSPTTLVEKLSAERSHG